MSENIKVAYELIELAERELFTGSFSESAIRADLESRKTTDNLSRFGSSGKQTNELSAKRQIYVQELGKWLNSINTALQVLHGSGNLTLDLRCKKCEEQANNLLNIVNNF